MNIYIWDLEYSLIPIIANTENEAKNKLLKALENEDFKNKLLRDLIYEGTFEKFIKSKPNVVNSDEVILYGHANY